MPGSLLLCLTLLGAAAGERGEARRLPPVALGLSGSPETRAGSVARGADPLPVRIVLRWEEMEPAEGDRRLDRIDALARSLPADRFAVVLCLTGGNRAIRPAGGAPGPEDPAYRQAWLEMVRAVARRARGWADRFQVWDEPQSATSWGGDPSPRDYAYLLKSTAVTVRSEIPWARIATGGLEGAVPEFLGELYGHGIAPYTDAVAIRDRPEAVADRDLAELAAAIRVGDPASEIWFPSIGIEGNDPEEAAADLLRQAGLAAGRGAALALFSIAEGPGAEAARAVLGGLRDRFPATVAPMPGSGEAPLILPGGETLAVRAYRFFDSSNGRILVWYETPPEPAGATGELVLPDGEIRDLVRLDPRSGGEETVGLYIPDRDRTSTRVDVELAAGPGLLAYRVGAAEDLRTAAEAIEVAGTSELSVEEILARHQEHRSAQDAVLRTYVADARVDLHFQLAGSQTLDVTYLDRFYYDRGVAEWEQRELYLNGVRWKGRRLPKIPLVQPDKVIILPLDLHLDRRYRYRLEGSELLDGHRAWRIAFQPEDPQAALYQGTVWIDQRSYARLQISLRQRGLEPPFVSNDEVDRYRPLVGPDGGEIWLLTEITGSQLYTTGGRSFTVNREVRFTDVRINPEDFRERLAEAHASDHLILRDTDVGFRYLRKDADGERVLDDEIAPDTLFWLGGVFYNAAVDFPVPLAGVNYFTFDVAGSGTQMNVFFAGAFLAFNATDPDLFGGPLEGGIDVSAQAVDFTDRLFVDGEEIDEQAVDRKTQGLRLFLGAPFLDYARLTGSYELDWDLFSRAADTAPGFLTPVDTFVHSVGLDFDFNRRGWTFEAGGGFHRRQDWEPWGTPAEQAAFRPETRDWLTWEASLAKNIFLPRFQKVRLQGRWRAGRDLDRFSAFQFPFFGDTLAGFSGSGVRYERGLTLGAAYAFDLFEVVRLEATLGYARVWNPAESPEPRDFGGLGIGAEFMGPWGTLLNVEWGIAAHSDIRSLEGEQEVRFFFLKLF